LILLPQIRAGIITACIFVFIPILVSSDPVARGGASGSLIGTSWSTSSACEYAEGSALAIVIAVSDGLLIIFRPLPAVKTWSPVADRIDPIDMMPVSRHARRTRKPARHPDRRDHRVPLHPDRLPRALLVRESNTPGLRSPA